MKKLVTLGILGVLLFLGFLFTTIGWMDYKTIKNGVPIEATITDIHTEGSITHSHYDGSFVESNMKNVVNVKFTEPSTTLEVEKELGYYTYTMYEGETLKLYYDETSGDLASEEGGKVALIIGIVFLSLSGAYILFLVVLVMFLLRANRLQNRKPKVTN